MKTNELKSLLEKMDYSVKHINEIIVIKNEYGNVIATIEKDITFKFSTQYYAWNFISYSEQKIILSYIMGYAKTPIDEREEEKSKIYMIYDWSSECIKILSKYKTKALAKVAKDALFGDCIDDYKLIEIDLDEVEDD